MGDHRVYGIESESSSHAHTVSRPAAGPTIAPNRRASAISCQDPARHAGKASYCKRYHVPLG
jgi:hypothetical protein